MTEFSTNIARYGPPDGNLTRNRTVETISWVGFKIRLGWTHTDPAGHVHTAEGYQASTYQPTQEIYCVDCEQIEERPNGERRCRECDAVVTLQGDWGCHRDLLPGGFTWTVEYIGRGVRYLWREVPDELGIEIFEHGAIHPFLDRLATEVGEADENEWWTP